MRSISNELRPLVHQLVHDLGHHRHDDLPVVCEELGLPAPPDKAPPPDVADARELTKSQRLEQVFAQIEVRHYPEVLGRFLARGDLPAQTRQVLAPHSQYVQVPANHVIHMFKPKRYVAEVRAFYRSMA